MHQKTRDQDSEDRPRDEHDVTRPLARRSLDGLAPLTRSLRGIASGSELTDEDYRRYLEDKHS